MAEIQDVAPKKEYKTTEKVVGINKTCDVGALLLEDSSSYAGKNE